MNVRMQRQGAGRSLACALFVWATFSNVWAGTVTSPHDDGSPGTLRAVVAAAAPGEVIDFHPSVYGLIAVTDYIIINKNLIIQGPGADLLSVDGDNAAGIFGITAGVTVEISGLTISNGSAPFGAGINTSGNLTLLDCVLYGNTAKAGGAIANFGSLNATNCQFMDNVANGPAGFGGAIANQPGVSSSTLTNCRFERNSAVDLGGAVSARGNHTFTGCTFRNNTAGRRGGAIFGGLRDGGDAWMASNCVFEDNEVTNPADGLTDGGGAILFQSNAVPASAEIVSSAFNRNVVRPVGSGGAIHVVGEAPSSVAIRDCSFNLNSVNSGGVTNFGGAIFCEQDQFSVDGCSFSKNSARAGGAIFNFRSLLLSNSSFEDNFSPVSGGAVISANIRPLGASSQVTGCTFERNVTGGASAPVVAIRGNHTISGCTFRENRGWFGGALLLAPREAGDAMEVLNCTFERNSADTSPSGSGVGGAVFLSLDAPSGSVRVKSCTFVQNVARKGTTTWDGDGGAMYIDNAPDSIAATVESCLFAFNTAELELAGGGGIAVASANFQESTTIVNCTLYGNVAPKGGGISMAYGLTNPGEVTLNVINCVLWNNVATATPGTDEISVSQNAWGLQTNRIIVSHCDVKGGLPADPFITDAGGNINADPLFVAPGTDFRLMFGSPCINKGLNTGSLSATDLDGNPRIVGAAPDMGCFEFQGPSPQQVAAEIRGRVHQLVGAGTLTTTQGNNLLTRLDAAMSAYAEGKIAKACAKLDGFITEVQKYVSKRILTAAQGQQLIDLALQLKALFGC